eukprot:m.168510 g.168510  ORF g.168510 m.168510 type:complete len:60 (-) comp25085_c0_seq1:1129-1308(-)
MRVSKNKNLAITDSSGNFGNNFVSCEHQQTKRIEKSLLLFEIGPIPRINAESQWQKIGN